MQTFSKSFEPTLSVVIPVHNEAGNIRLLAEICAALLDEWPRMSRQQLRGLVVSRPTLQLFAFTRRDVCATA